MTAQLAEQITFGGQLRPMFATPLSALPDFRELLLTFRSPHTACRRGYVGTWTLENGLLALSGLVGWTSDGLKLGLNFSDHPAGVPAKWFSGVLRLPDGEQLKYVHGGFESIFERDILLTIEAGYLVKEEVRTNTLPTISPSATRPGETFFERMHRPS